MKEFNKHTLIEAIAGLPEHDAPDNVWSKVQQKIRLKDGLEALPQYQPPADIWQRVQNQTQLSNALKELPEYQPPQEVWNQIEKDISESSTRKKAQMVSLSARNWWAVAAVFTGLVVTAFGLLLVGSDAPKDTLTYQTIEVEDRLLARDWNEDEDGFEAVFAICKKSSFVCEKPSFKSLKLELDELNDAKMMLEEAIGNYGTAPHLISEMREIEFERTRILKAMMDVFS